MKIGNVDFDTKTKTYIMGIVNLTPDSFFKPSRVLKKNEILKRVETMLNEGAHIIDIGAESTRPGHVKVLPREQLKRLNSVVLEIKKNLMCLFQLTPRSL